MPISLEDIDKKNLFEVPEGYFEELPEKIQKKISDEGGKPKTRDLPAWTLGIAASLLFLLGFFITMNDSSVDIEAMLADVSEEDLATYVAFYDLDTEDIAMAFPVSTSEIGLEEDNAINEIPLEGESIEGLLLEYDIEIEDLEI